MRNKLGFILLAKVAAKLPITYFGAYVIPFKHHGLSTRNALSPNIL